MGIGELLKSMDFFAKLGKMMFESCSATNYIEMCVRQKKANVKTN